MRRFVWHPSECALPQVSAGYRIAGRTIALVGGGTATASRVARALEQQGAVVHRFEACAPQEEPAAVAFVQRIGRLDGIVDLNLSDQSPGGTEGWEAPLRQSVALLKSVYRDWAAETDAERLFYVAVTCLGGTMGYTGASVPAPLGGIWAGLAKSLPRELPSCWVKVLDLAPDEEERIGEHLVRELAERGLFEIGYRDGRRYTLSALPEEVGPPTLTLDARDTILMSGGGRGIGFALARALARTHGCRVVLTGRTPLPAANEPWLQCDTAEFRRLGQEQLLQRAPGERVADWRREQERRRSCRELVTNLNAAQAEGLRIEYRVCDVGIYDQVHALLTDLGTSLTGVIHNAGVDAPLRLPGKSLEGFTAVIRVKIQGFLNLVRALEAKPVALAFFCSVGSMTGRLGGMIGETDYGAANEGLTRLGFWAAREKGLPVQTLCWPTWERLGMIANFAVATRYMAALPVEEGVEHWRRELLGARTGEVTFLGQLGGALSPRDLRGFPITAALPQAREIAARLAALGRVLHYQPFYRLHTRHTLSACHCPALTDFRVEGIPALPISLALELALSVGAWITPEGGPDLALHAVRGIEIALGALKAEEGTVAVESEGVGQWQGDQWVVQVTLTRPSGLRLATLELVYAAAPAAVEVPRVRDEAAVSLFPEAVGTGMHWSGWVFPRAQWRARPDGRLCGKVRACTASDLWVLPVTPALTLPVSALESVFRVTAPPALPARLSIARMGLGGRLRDTTEIAQEGPGIWTLSGSEGPGALRLEGLCFGA